MTNAILYSFRRCPYAMRARMALYASQINYEHREVVLRDKPDHMLEVSPKGTVPVFIQSNGDVIEESLELMHFALEQNDPHDWFNCNIDDAKNLIDANDGPFKHHLDRYKYASRYKDDAARGDVDLSHRDSAEEHLQALEERLENHNYLLGNKQSYADIAIFPFIRQFANTDLDWWKTAPYPKLRQWLQHHVQSDIFKTIMEKFPQWKPIEVRAV